MAMDAIKKACPEVIILPSTGGAVGMTAEERLQPVDLVPEVATLDCGTCNFGGDDIFVNTETMVKTFAEKVNALGVKPECECFDKGMIDTAVRMADKSLLKKPLHFNLVLGVNGGISATARDLTFMVDSLPAGSSWCVTGIGRSEFPMAAVAITMGGHVRVGFEDNVYVAKGMLAESNGELVAKVVELAKLLGRDIASPAEARRILGIHTK
jgi:3-keto-5-aminohexanoate cleavage enzyme